MNSNYTPKYEKAAAANGPILSRLNTVHGSIVELQKGVEYRFPGMVAEIHLADSTATEANHTSAIEIQTSVFPTSSEVTTAYTDTTPNILAQSEPTESWDPALLQQLRDDIKNMN